jgi:LPPG:FO 2-phospho-L-lactate transferase
MITALAGGVGAAKFLRGLVRVVPPSEITVIVNIGDDFVLHGLSISPDIDTVTYTLAELADEERGWGVAGETWAAMEQLDRLGGETWFRLGDRDLAMHLYRTQRRSQGAPLSEVAKEVASSLGVGTRVLPVSNDPVATTITLASGTEVSFQDYFVRLAHDVPVRAVRFAGAEQAKPAAGVLEGIRDADTVVICPSNPFVSIGPILAVAGIDEALAGRRERVVAVSPIIAGSALKGPADRMLAQLGHEPTAAGVAALYAELAATFVIDTADSKLASSIEALGMRCVVTDTVMSTPAKAAELARTVLGNVP